MITEKIRKRRKGFFTVCLEVVLCFPSDLSAVSVYTDYDFFDVFWVVVPKISTEIKSASTYDFTVVV